MAIRVAMLGMKGIPAKSGADRAVEALAVRLKGHDVEPTVYCGRFYTPADACVPGVRLIRLPSLPGKYFRATSLDVLAALHAVLFGKYDLVHMHNSEASFVLPLLRLRFHVIATRQGSAYLRAKWGRVATWLLRATDVPYMLLSNTRTSVSAQEARTLSARFGRDVLYIPNGVGSEYDPDHEAAKQILQRHGLAPGEYLLFSAGRIEPTKGVHWAISAVNRLGDACPPLLVVGDDSHHPEYTKQLHAMAGPRIRFQSFIETPGCVFGLMANARCLIFPSTNEGMSMVLLEAASLGVPIVCSDISENRQVMAGDAVYFAPGDDVGLTTQLGWVLENRDEMRAMGDRAREHVRRQFAWDEIVSRYAQLYRAECGKSQARRTGSGGAAR